MRSPRPQLDSNSSPLLRATESLRPLLARGVVAWAAICGGVLLDARPASAQPAGLQQPASAPENSSPPPSSDPFVTRLQGFGLSATTESLRGYFQSLTPSPQQQTRWEELIEALGADAFAAREAAMKELLRQPAAVRPQLDAAQKHADFEIRWRARILADSIERDGQDLLYTALAVVSRQKTPGLCEELLLRTADCSTEGLQQVLAAAIEASVRPADAAVLRDSLSATDPQRRRLAVIGLVAATGKSAGDSLLPLLDDADPGVQAAAAKGMVELGRREGLRTLVALLDADDIRHRTLAYRTLRAATGAEITYVVYDPPERRAPAVAAWKKWLTEAGSTVAIRTPLAEVQIDLGRILICDPSGARLVEFDLDGRQLWEQSTPQQPWACLGLANGHRLVGLFNDRALVEYDAVGKEVWRHAGLPGGPTSVERLENGNTLVACTEGQEVLEVSRAGAVVWRAKLAGRPVDARRLPEGSTLVALQNLGKVVEVDHTGKVIWELGGVPNVFCAQRLETGNTLIACLGMTLIREFNRDGKVVWSQGKFVNPYTCQRLASGLTLVTDQKGVYEMDQKGEIVRKWPVPRVSRAHRY